MLQQSFNHKERRFLIPAKFLPVIQADLDALPSGRTYEVRTQYLDTPERTWSALTMGEEHPKIRLRLYVESNDQFLEKKLHTKDGQTVKERVAVVEKPEGLCCVGSVSYTRTEYEIDGARVTIDRNVRGSESCDVLEPLLIEVKGSIPPVLDFARPFERKNFSKWKWLTGKINVYQW